MLALPTSVGLTESEIVIMFPICLCLVSNAISECIFPFPIVVFIALVYLDGLLIAEYGIKMVKYRLKLGQYGLKNTNFKQLKLISHSKHFENHYFVRSYNEIHFNVFWVNFKKNCKKN